MNTVNPLGNSFMDTYQQRLDHEGNAIPSGNSFIDNSFIDTYQQTRIDHEGNARGPLEQALLEQQARSRVDRFHQQLLRDESANQSLANTSSLHSLRLSGAYQPSVPSWLHQSQQSQQADAIAQLLAQRQQQQQQQQQSEDSFVASPSSNFEGARRLEELKQLQAALQRRTGSGMGAGGLFPSLAAGGQGAFDQVAFDQFSPAVELLLAKQQQQQQESLCRPLIDLYSSSGVGSGAISRHLLHQQQQQQQQQGCITDPFSADRKRPAQDLKETSESSGRKCPSLSSPPDAPNKRKKKRLTAKGNSFPLPAVRGVKELSSSVPEVHSNSTHNPIKLLSYSKCWQKLSGGEMQAEIFRQRLHRGKVPITGKTKSVILLSQRKK
jgi:hypothetical protein